MMFIIGYSNKTFNGKTINKAVVCKNYDEYLRVKNNIENIAKRNDEVKLIEFDIVIPSENIPNGCY